jgi:threonine/homoserine/homoserine lactone efflux protein
MDFINYQIITFITITLVLTVTPGMDTIIILRNVLRGGKLDGYYTAFGICSGLFVHASISSLGISVILANSVVLFSYMRTAGAFYLIWLGASTIYGAFRNKQPILLTKKPIENMRVQPLKSFREGITSNVLNPKPAIFYMAFFPQFIGQNDSVFTKSMLLASIQFVIGVSWLIILSHLICRLTYIIEKPSVKKSLDMISGSILVLLGLKLGLENN